MNKRHSWKIKKDDIYEIISLKNSKTKIHKFTKIEQCIHCGLKKGFEIKNTGYDFVWRLVYFSENNEFLSYDVLPYKCVGKNNSFLLSEKDFYIK